MRLEDLVASVGRTVPVTPAQWAFALLLGESRRLSNKHRAAHANRGFSGNKAVDLHGALGEMLIYGIVKRLGDRVASAYMRKHLFRAGGGAGVKGADLSFREGGKLTGIDVKTFDCAPRKRYFAINDQKHTELQGHADWYLGLIGPPFAREAYLTRLIPYDAVSGWECRVLLRQERADKGASASRNLKIEDFMARYGDPAFTLQPLATRTYPHQEILLLASAQGPESVGAQLMRWLPPITPFVRRVRERLRADLARAAQPLGSEASSAGLLRGSAAIDE